MSAGAHPALWAQIDQLVEHARSVCVHIDAARDSEVCLLLSEILTFLNTATPGDDLSIRMHALAIGELVQSVRENPPCSDSYSPGSSP